MSNNFRYNIKLAIDCITDNVDRSIARSPVSEREQYYIHGQLHGIDLVIECTDFKEEKTRLEDLKRKVDGIKII